ncbi:hypothetical protein [Duganella sp. HH105]|uniref:hypothetical protein n=1 Tax=Duganella sp. HH105 TaxID=1781067 RepID=UPI000877D09D|nr:hypothetical protein [Duganella sp. HH105]OEZ59111.1 hypothetical protein DUGA6_36920 [Duganella sp. HH105]
MNEYIILMLDDAPGDANGDWDGYIARLRQTGQFDGGSSIGSGQRLKKGQPEQAAGLGVTGFIRVRAASIDDAKLLLAGNPDYEAGGSVEIRELPPG